ncbi:MAG TPA: cell division protein FtsA [Flavobacteriales bacterium]|jgi:cell division protein FtsA|nr:cell division protein FtsA [Flavobacteriales bacterium]
MESNEQIIVGLDIGTTKIACLVGKKNEYGKLELLGMGKAESVGVRRGVVSHITPAVQAIRMAVEEAKLNSGQEIAVVNVGIAGQHIKSLQHRGVITLDNLDDEISQKDVDALIQDMHKLVLPPGESIIHVLPQDFIVDNESGIKDPIGMSGIRLEANFHIITGLVTAVQNIYKCVRKADLEVADLTLEPLASSDSVLSAEEKEAGVALVDIGGGTTDVAIFQDGIIRHTAVIPFGGNIITDDIKEGCTIIRKQAELLKVKFGSALASENQANDIVVIPGLNGRDPKEISVKNLAHIIQARMEEIIEQVYFEIRNSGYERKLIAGIVITGGGSQLKHISQLFEYLTGMDTRIGYPTEHLASGNEKVASPMYATGVGLVLKGFEYAEKQQRRVSTVGKTIKTKKKNGLFDKILNKGKEWFEEDDQF